MKEIKAIIKPDLLDKVIHELRNHAEIPGATICEVNVFGRERPSDTSNEQRPKLGGFGYQRMIKLEIVVADHLADSVRDLIATSARTGQPGDGMVFTIPVDSGVRIRSGKSIEGDP